MNSWSTESLGQLVSFMTSGSRGWAQYYSDNGALFIRIQNVGMNQLFLDDLAYVTAPDTAEAKRTRVQAGDVLISITADLGRTAVVPEGLGDAFINQHLAVLRTSKIDPHFLSLYLTSPDGQVQVHRLDRVGVKSGLNFDDLRSIAVPMPPPAEQRHIVAALARADVSPHVIRHSRAMHLYDSGVPLPYIRDILGHVELATTDIYARASTEAKRKALEAAYTEIVTDNLPEWSHDHGLLSWLASL